VRRTIASLLRVFLAVGALEMMCRDQDPGAGGELPRAWVGQVGKKRKNRSGQERRGREQKSREQKATSRDSAMHWDASRAVRPA
jgi:hypothetical protein